MRAYRTHSCFFVPSLMMIKLKPPSFLWKLLILLPLAWLIVWGVASVAAPQIAKLVVPRIQAKAKSLGIEIDSIQFKSVRVSPWLNEVTANKLTMQFDLSPRDQHSLSSTFQCEAMRVQLKNPFKIRGAVQVQDFDVKFHQADIPKGFPFDSFTNGHVTLGDVPLLSPRDAFKQMIAGVIDLFDDNRASGEFEFRGSVQINVGKNNIPARIYTERRDEEFRLRFDELDVRSVAKEMKIQLADDQVVMVSYFPLRVPIIVVITERARELSLRYYADDLWKQDALRHTTWSFMLTQTFGFEFAKLVTDAQEAKPGNEYYERLMDYNNNAVGRAWVAEKVQLGQIPHLLLTDPRVVLSPEAAKARGEGQLLK